MSNWSSKRWEIDRVIPDGGHPQLIRASDRFRLEPNALKCKLKPKHMMAVWKDTDFEEKGGRAPALAQLLPPFVPIPIVEQAYEDAVDQILQQIQQLERLQADSVVLGPDTCKVRIVCVEDAILLPNGRKRDLLVIRVDALGAALQSGSAHGTD